MGHAKLLVIDDQPLFVQMLFRILSGAGYDVASAGSGEEALRHLERPVVNLVILDLTLPGLSGTAVLRRIRGGGSSHLPVLVLTATRDDEVEAMVLRAGADDFLGKPFSQTVLLARIEALLRRAGGPAPPPLRLELSGGITVDLGTLVVERGGHPIHHLTPLEATLLGYLARRPNLAVDGADLHREVWNLQRRIRSHALVNTVYRLRRKIEAEPGRPRHLVAAQGVGYRFVP